MSRRKMAARNLHENLPVYSAVAVEDETENPFASATAVAMQTTTAEYTATAVGVEIPLAGEQSSAHLAYRARMQQYQSQGGRAEHASSTRADFNSLIGADDDWANQIASEMTAFTSGWGSSASDTATQARYCFYFLLLLLLIMFMFSLWLFTLADDSEALQDINSFVAGWSAVRIAAKLHWFFNSTFARSFSSSS